MFLALLVFNTFHYLYFLQLKNVDFDGLFGNISTVINMSQRLFDTLQDTDSIGKEPLFKRRLFTDVMVVHLQSNQASSFLMLHFALYSHCTLSPGQISLAE